MVPTYGQRTSGRHFFRVRYIYADYACSANGHFTAVARGYLTATDTCASVFIFSNSAQPGLASNLYSSNTGGDQRESQGDQDSPDGRFEEARLWDQRPGQGVRCVPRKAADLPPNERLDC